MGMALIVMSLVSCTNSKNVNQGNDTRVLMRDSIDSQGIQRMQVSKVTQTVTFNRKEYQSYVQRMPSDSLPRVKNMQGDVFVDNVITLRITQSGKNVFSRTFTKHSFSSLMSSDFLRKAILEGMVFDKTTSKGFVYAVSVSYPQTDLYFPISVTITPDGKMIMEKEELMEDIYLEEE